MKLAALTRVKIDGDVIEEFVRHTLQFVDEIVIIDNRSPDATASILQALEAERLPISVRQDDYIEARADLITRYAREVFAEASPDFVLPLDADEFLKVESRAALESALRALPKGSYGLAPWTTYVPVPHENRQETRVLARMRYRLEHEPRQSYKAFVGRSFAETGDSFIPGTHEVKSANGTSVPNAVLKGVSLGHFPVRSVAQIQSKALLGWTACIAAGYDLTPGHDAEDGMAIQWRKLYEKLRSWSEWPDELLYEAPAVYFGNPPHMPEPVYDPLIPVERRYTEASPCILEIALEFTRQLAQIHAKLTNDNERLSAELASYESRDAR